MSYYCNSTTVVQHNYKLKPGQYLNSCSCRKMGRRCPGNGEPIQLQFALSSAELLSAHSMTLLDNRSPLISSSRHRRRDLCSSDSCSLEPPSTARLFSRHSVFKVGLASKRQRIYSKKRCSSSPSFSSTYNLTTNQRAPRSQKWQARR